MQSSKMRFSRGSFNDKQLKLFSAEFPFTSTKFIELVEENKQLKKTIDVLKENSVLMEQNVLSLIEAAQGRLSDKEILEVENRTNQTLCELARKERDQLQQDNNALKQHIVDLVKSDQIVSIKWVHSKENEFLKSKLIGLKLINANLETKLAEAKDVEAMLK